MGFKTINKTWKTKQGCEIHQIPLLSNNVFLIRHDNCGILVDSGTKNTELSLLNFLNLLGCKLCKIENLVLTHSHYDHCMNAARIKKIYEPSVICGQPEAIYLKSGYRPLPKGTMWFTKFLIGFSKTAPDGFIRSRFSYSPVFPDVEITEPYLLSLKENKIEILPTPGHTDGSISIIVNNEIALVGDAAFGLSKKTIFPPFADNSKQLIESWGILLKTDCQYFLPAHGNFISRERLKKEYNKFRIKRVAQ